MLNFFLVLAVLFLICFSGFHIFIALMAGAGAAALATGSIAWAILVGCICAFSVGVLALLLFAGFWIFIFAGLIGLGLLIAVIFFPIFLPILLPLFIVYLIFVIIKKKNDNIRKIP
jgi:hypothetical protein